MTRGADTPSIPLALPISFEIEGLGGYAIEVDRSLAIRAYVQHVLRACRWPDDIGGACLRKLGDLSVGGNGA